MVGVSTLLYLLCLGSVQAGKLLVIPADGSHWTGMKPLVEELGRRGNQVVVVIPEASLSMGPSEHTTTLTYPVPYTKAQMKERVASNLEALFSVDTSTDTAKFVGFFFTLQMLQNLTVKNAESLLYHEDLMVKLKDLEFDALLTDPFEPMGVIMGEYLSIPSIYMQVNLPCGVDSIASQCPSPPSYVPQRYTFYTEVMSFWERSVNLVRTILQPAACRRLYTRADEIASRFLQREASVVEIMSRAAIWLMRLDFAFEFSRPLMPNMITIGGMSAVKPKPLAQVSFKQFNDAANEFI
ncbi:UDP-glucuronosyltransferase 1-1-like isoform X4 [Astyanax mexicanus]|uniref:UDP-glucuronosyltransferase 1-1-like isoform X4 n=1 Tax=Astyanax mexicanus TaxID=7994 RepID=A0A8T2LIX5_ASTMX|nr:UDP-glucuronosyltransferase 1-1-like isoform X4 [Astyanax mexicanus]